MSVVKRVHQIFKQHSSIHSADLVHQQTNKGTPSTPSFSTLSLFHFFLSNDRIVFKLTSFLNQFSQSHNNSPSLSFERLQIRKQQFSHHTLTYHHHHHVKSTCTLHHHTHLLWFLWFLWFLCRACHGKISSSQSKRERQR